MLDTMVSFFQNITTSFAMGQSLSYALGLVLVIVSLLAFRELANWFFKNNHIHAEILSLSEQLNELDRKMDELKESLVTSQKKLEEPVETSSPIQENVKKEFHLESSVAQKDSFPL